MTQTEAVELSRRIRELEADNQRLNELLVS
jgi:hypothetical protein